GHHPNPCTWSDDANTALGSLQDPKTPPPPPGQQDLTPRSGPKDHTRTPGALPRTHRIAAGRGSPGDREPRQPPSRRPSHPSWDHHRTRLPVPLPRAEDGAHVRGHRHTTCRWPPLPDTPHRPGGGALPPQCRPGRGTTHQPAHPPDRAGPKGAREPSVLRLKFVVEVGRERTKSARPTWSTRTAWDRCSRP